MRHAWEAARKIPRRFDYIGYLNIIPICTTLRHCACHQQKAAKHRRLHKWLERRHLISSRNDVFNSIKRIDKDIAISREIFERCAYTTGDVFSFHKQPHTLHRAFDSGFYLNRINIMPRLNHIIHLGIASRLLTMPAIQRIRAIARGSLYQFCCDKNFSNSTTIHHK